MLNFLAVAPYLAATGNALSNLDENASGADDLAGTLLEYAADVILAVAGRENLPPLPTILAQGTTEKITGAARVSLIVASSVIGIARFQTTGKAQAILRYVDESLKLLLAGKPVPAAPFST